MKLRASKAGRLVVVAKPIVKTAPMIHNNKINGRRLTKSPRGETRSNAEAYPACVKDGTFEILSYVTPNVVERCIKIG